MSTIHFHQTTTLTPEQYIAGLTDFGPGRSKVFSNSADSYLKVHHVGPTDADVTEGSGGVWERLHYDWSDPDRVVLTTTDSNTWGGASGYTYTFGRSPDGATDVDVVIVRQGKNAKGRLLALVLGSVGKGVLKKSFVNSVKAIEARNNGATHAHDALGSKHPPRRRGERGRHARDGHPALSPLPRRRRSSPRSSPGSPPTASRAGTSAPAPALVAKRLLERVTEREVPPRYARALNNVTHWGFGLAAGAAYGLLAGVAQAERPVRAPVRRRGLGRRIRRPPRCSACTSRSGSTTSRRSRRT